MPDVVSCHNWVVTGRERILAAFQGGALDTVPFAPNIYYWFYNHQVRGTLPEEIAGAEHPFDVLRYLGADILARWDTQYATKEVYSAGEFRDAFGGASRFDRPVTTAFNIYPPHTNARLRKFVTPHGTLTHTWTLSEEAGADFESEFWWKDWSDYRAIRFLLESREYVFDAAEFRSWKNRVGGDGVMMVHLTQSPLKTFHWLAGPENASLFLIDHPGEMKELAQIHEEKALALLREIVDEPECEVFMSLDNLDSAFYPPYFYEDYCHSFYSRAAGIIHGRGKHLCVHACGHQKALLPLVGRSRVDCLEGVTPPPMGDVELKDVRDATGYEDFVVNGGMDASRMEADRDAEEFLHRYTRDLFRSMGGRRRFIYASSCATSILTPWENLLYVRDAAREYGRTG